MSKRTKAISNMQGHALIGSRRAVLDSTGIKKPMRLATAVAILLASFVTPVSADKHERTVVPPVSADEYKTSFETGEPNDWSFAGDGSFVRSIIRHSGEKSDAHTGWVFANIKSKGDWSAVYQWRDVRASDSCVFAAWLKTSATLTGGYMTIRRDNGNHQQGAIIREVKLVGARPLGNPNDNGYQLVEIDFPTNDSTSVLFYVGMYGDNNEPWIQIDDIAIICDPMGPSESGENGHGPPNK